MSYVNTGMEVKTATFLLQMVNFR